MAFGDNQIDGYTEGEEPLVFHYKKGEFRKYESEKYRNIATGVDAPARGFFKVLVASKGNRILFITMMMCFVLMLVMSIFSAKSNVDTVGGVTCELTAFSFQDKVYASLKLKKFRNEKVSEGYRNLNIEFFLIDADGNTVAKYETGWSFDMGNKEEEFVRATFTDYEAYSASCAVSCNDDSRIIKSSIERR
ncbi:MAG: hypothetical protein K6G00_12165 [Treponema sp.]|nr:hypothetical protein [Treponema sp.]